MHHDLAVKSVVLKDDASEISKDTENEPRNGMSSSRLSLVVVSTPPGARRLLMFDQAQSSSADQLQSALFDKAGT